MRKFYETFKKSGKCYQLNLFKEFEDGLNQRLGANSEQERDVWVQALRMAGEIEDNKTYFYQQSFKKPNPRLRFDASAVAISTRAD